jgi:hypothetical protein
VYIISTPFCLQTKRNGGSLTSSIGASKSGKFPKSIFPILTDIQKSIDNLAANLLKSIDYD